MHGAGLVNSYFMKQGSAFVEIFPCGTGGSPLFDSFREPHRIEGGVVGLSVFIRNDSLCQPYNPEPYEQGYEGRLPLLRACCKLQAWVWFKLQPSSLRSVHMHIPGASLFLICQKCMTYPFGTHIMNIDIVGGSIS